jgi:hypothetical protein
VGCPWWRAWWHRRLRRQDLTVTWVALRETGATRYPDDEEAAVLFALKAWAIFIQQPGQQHWHCACAERDGD